MDSNTGVSMGIGDVFYKNKFLIDLLRYLVGLVFIFSSITKLVDFHETLDFFVGTIGTQYELTKFLLTFLILVELTLGTMIMLQFTHHQIVYNITIGLLAFFILVSIGFIYKDIDNCGCFGTVVAVKPLPTIVKNLFLIATLMFLKNKEQNKNYAS